MAKKDQTPQRVQIGKEQIGLLGRLSNACAVSGDEREVRRIVLEEVRPYADEVKVDALGNVLVTRLGSGDQRPRVLLTAHMDEVGLMLIHDEGEGVFRFSTVGHINVTDLAAKVMWVGSQHIPGVIGMKPIHLTNAEERKKTLKVDDLRLDLGAANGKVKVGDRAVFSTTFIQQGPSLRGKALDNRLGVAMLIELVKQTIPQIDLLAAFTVQEEIGLRGAQVAAYAFNPDLAIILDSSPAYDMPSLEEDENLRYNTRLGEGGAIYVADGGTLSDPRLVHYLIETAEKHGIRYQLRQPGSGGTEAGAVHKQRAGIPSVSISVPGRYHHGPASIARLSDWQDTLRLVSAALSDLTADVLAGER